MKAEVYKLDINNLVNVPNGLNKLNSKVHDLGFDKLKTVPMDLKKIKWCSEQRSCDKNSVQQTEFKSKLYNKIRDATTFIPINQCNTDQQNLENKTVEIESKITWS